jgi:DNA-binding transcriptional ArsR family regulator
MFPNVAKVASLIGDPVRSRMLLSLLDGGELSASDLAHRGGASAQAASAHLSKLVEGGLLRARTQGRQRFFQLSSTEIAQAMEMLAIIAPKDAVTSLRQHTLMQRLREARTCYDHLAGKLGVGLTEALTAKRFLTFGGDEYNPTKPGERLFSQLDIDLNALRSKRRCFARPCMDWTEKRHHLAGSLGAAILDAFVQRRWILRNSADRSLKISAEGQTQLSGMFGIDVA